MKLSEKNQSRHVPTRQNYKTTKSKHNIKQTEYVSITEYDVSIITLETRCANVNKNNANVCTTAVFSSVNGRGQWTGLRKEARLDYRRYNGVAACKPSDRH